MDQEQPNTLLTMTADIVATYLANNNVAAAEVPTLIASVHASLSNLGQTQADEPASSKSTGAVTARKSLSNPKHIISMIDGKPYAMLTRHIKGHGYTPQTYRQAFGLAPDYPMVAPDYSELRRELAKSIGLGRTKAAPAAEAPAPQRRKLRIKVG